MIRTLKFARIVLVLVAFLRISTFGFSDPWLVLVSTSTPNAWFTNATFTTPSGFVKLQAPNGASILAGSIITLPPPSPIATNLAANGISSSAMALTWSPLAPTWQSTLVCRVIATLPGTATNAVDSGLASSTTYNYIAIGLTNAPAPNGTTLGLIAPTNLIVVATSSNAVTVTLQYAGTNAAGFYWQSATSALGPWIQRGYTPSNNFTYAFITLAPESTNYFHACAFDSTNGLSAFSAPIMGITQ